ncbi:MAG: ATP-grasp fold amidoligase family protein [Burkholderiaceae bacterium]
MKSGARSLGRGDSMFRYFSHRVLARGLPKNKIGDHLFAYVLFVARHKRLPTRRLLFSDVLYRMKVSGAFRDPLRVYVSDKEFVKDYVKAKIGDVYNVPTFAILRSVEEIDGYEFPAACCIKPTHACNEVILRRNGEPVDVARLRSWFSLDYYETTREVNYKNLRPKIIVEKLLFGGSNVNDYKFLCFKGVPRLIQVDVGRHIGHRRMIFDPDWKPQDFSFGHPRASFVPERPDNLEEMVSVANKLAAGFDFVRIDLYSDGGRCYVGEITNCPGGAGNRFIPPDSESRMSEMIFVRKNLGS